MLCFEIKTCYDLKVKPVSNRDGRVVLAPSRGTTLRPSNELSTSTRSTPPTRRQRQAGNLNGIKSSIDILSDNVK